MKRPLRHIALLIVCSAIMIGLTFPGGRNKPAKDFLDSLSPAQYEKTARPFQDTTRETWHFLPAAMWPRVGLPLSELHGGQRILFYAFLEATLSKAGYEKVVRIIDLENVLISLGDNISIRDPEQYYIAFYGTPGDLTWSWSFEGHHISLTFTHVKDQVSVTPKFFGASPAVIPSGPRKGQRLLAQEEDLGRQLVRSLTSVQQQQAIFRDDAYPDIVTSAASRVSAPEPVGIPAEAMTDAQRALLFALLDVHLDYLTPDLAMRRQAHVRQEKLRDLYFGWAGGLAPGEPHYYAIQGKSFILEYDNTQNNANHIHTVWRDFDGDFGRDLLKEHYKHSGHH